MYMCRETLRKAVVQKFNDIKGWNCQTLDDLYDKIEDRNEANQIINSLKICDPAVGSGHFLVSALNEIIAIKNDLNILQDKNGRRLKEYQVIVENDELIITDEDHQPFTYTPKNQESQRIQETLFHEKQTIIENCLLGVDINPNSVKICRLRLWIELLKNAYYKEESNYTELETLPNIDINIKCGNSLISRFPLDADLKPALKKSGIDIETYQNAVQTYRHAENKQQKRDMERLINSIKSNFKTTLQGVDPKKTKLRQLEGEVYNLENQLSLFEETKTEQKAREKKIIKLNNEIDKLRVEIEEIESGKIYENAFEWRFEFPEVLDDDANFIGFDVVIGNPPYIRQEEIKTQKPYLQTHFRTYSGTADLYVFFVEKAFEILRGFGNFCYIMPNKWMQTGYGKALRILFLENQLQGIIDFGYLQVFEEATTYPCILNASKQSNNADFISAAVKTLNYIHEFSLYIESISNQITVEALNDETWVISSGSDQTLLSTLKNKCMSLAEYIDGEAFRGVVTGLTEAFILDDKEKYRIVMKDPKSWELLKPVLRGRTLKKWYAEQDNLWLIGTFPTLNINIDDYPAIRDYLLKFGKNRLEQSGEEGSRKKTSGEWFETQDSIAYWQEFEKPKIMYQKFQVKPCFIYDDQGLYCNDSMWIISKSDKVLLAILNSKMGWWLISKYCTAIQNGYQLIWKYFGQIPIPNITKEQGKPIISLVDQILTTKKSNPNADTTILEQQIDQLVYELYGLTEEEIKIVEGKT
ncbi:Eco57I restriction-modification methylase domain-containing protein [Planktothrix agardhii 1033]|nr:Eco57I restriction-modification methylase domain-containing protein [Planktothrix agardhii 1033]